MKVWFVERAIYTQSDRFAFRNTLEHDSSLTNRMLSEY